jgi:hypothetical protein
LSWPLDGADLLGGIDVEALDVAVGGYRAERASAASLRRLP